MKKYIAMALLSAGVLTSCGEYNKVLKSTDYEYKYEAAKEYLPRAEHQGRYTSGRTGQYPERYDERGRSPVYAGYGPISIRVTT